MDNILGYNLRGLALVASEVTRTLQHKPFYCDECKQYYDYDEVSIRDRSTPSSDGWEVKCRYDGNLIDED